MHSSTLNKRSFYLVLLAMLVLHVALLPTQFKEFAESVVRHASKPIKVKIIQEAWKTMAAESKKQIVQSEDSVEKKKPTDPAFLSDKNRTFDRQTVAKTVASFKEAAKGKALVTNPLKEKSAQKRKANMKDLKLSDFGVQSGDPLPHKFSRSPASEAVKGLENGKPISEGLSATNDYVEEVALGDFTHLNTVEYKFYGFFHRIRQKLEQFWGKGIQEKAEVLFKSGRRLPASENLITSLQVTLNERGEIIAVKILGASGVKELDDAAIESFNQAGPFPNPPKGLLVNGKAIIEWGFVVKS